MHSDFAHAFAPGGRFQDEEGRVLRMSQHALGQLRITSGRVSCADPLTMDYDGEACGLARAVPHGEFEVEAAVAQVSADDARVACARVLFDPTRTAARWEPARYEGQEELGADEVSGAGVDSGTWGFFDAQAEGTVDEATADRWLAAFDANRVSTWTHHRAAIGDHHVVMMSSGWGDGCYGSYWGYAEDGTLVELVSDFEVLMGPVRSERVPLKRPLRRGKVHSEVLQAFGVTARVPWLAPRSVLIGGTGLARLVAEDTTAISVLEVGPWRRYQWPKDYRGTLAVLVMSGHGPLRRA